MRKRRANDEVLFSLDSFLDIVTNVVGVLVLVAMVTVVSAGNISVPSGATAMAAPRPSAERLLFECAGDEVYFIDEEGNGKRVLEEVERAGAGANAMVAPAAPPPRYHHHGRRGSRMGPQTPSGLITRDALSALLAREDVGDATHRVLAEPLDQGVAWAYVLRPGAHGERGADLDRVESSFRKRIAALEHGGFAYFVVHDDSFEVFRKARDLARARGVSVGWHPVEGQAAVRLSAIGSLGKRIQ